jgi:hypothetical protein
MPPIPSRLRYLLKPTNQNFAEYKCNFHRHVYVTREHKKFKSTGLNLLPTYLLVKDSIWYYYTYVHDEDRSFSLNDAANLYYFTPTGVRKLKEYGELVE